MKNLADLAKDWSEARKAMQKSVEDIPRIAGIIAVKVIRENFKLSAYDSGIGTERWVPRKPSTNASYDRGKTKNAKTGKLSKYRSGKNGTYKGSIFSSENPLLIQTRALIDSIQYRANKRNVFVGVDSGLVPYASAHNEGKNHQPKRQFMPYGNQKPTIKMLRAIESQIVKERNQILKKFKK